MANTGVTDHCFLVEHPINPGGKQRHRRAVLNLPRDKWRGSRACPLPGQPPSNITRITLTEWRMDFQISVEWIHKVQSCDPIMSEWGGE